MEETNFQNVYEEQISVSTLGFELKTFKVAIL